MTPFQRSSRWVATILSACIVLTACEEESIEEHRVEKGVESMPERPESPPAGSQGQAPAPHASTQDGSEGAAGTTAGEGDALPAWTVPEGWTKIPGERRMRIATFEAADPSGPVEVAITRFPGRVGGETANINRWRRQAGLPPARERPPSDIVHRFTSDGFEGYGARVEGPESHIVAVGVYEAARERTWFVRVTAGPDVADRLQPEVIDFARSIAGLPAREDP